MKGGCFKTSPQKRPLNEALNEAHWPPWRHPCFAHLEVGKYVEVSGGDAAAVLGFLYSHRNAVSAVKHLLALLLPVFCVAARMWVTLAFACQTYKHGQRCAKIEVCFLFLFC